MIMALVAVFVAFMVVILRHGLKQTGLLAKLHRNL